ncbi:MAG TPA: glycosyltransferase family 39 protein [Thermoanaerobaculia bacterium]|nr:glycosyltransferase family 39 protein [Thermoanaerobaculia bacterium]
MRAAGHGGSRLAAVLLLAVFTILCVHGLRWDTPTVDEFAHLPSGWYTLKTGRFDLFPLNPPLIKVLSALPLLALNPRLDPAARIENTGWYPWVYGTGFMELNRAEYDRIFLLGRLPVMVLGLLLGWLVFRWAQELYGDEAGLIALFLTVFFPSLIAHSHLATVDVGLAFFLVLTLYLFWRFVDRPTPWLLVACGVALGLAQLSKFTALLLYPVLVLLALGRGRRKLASLALIFLISVLVIDAGYLFQGIGNPVRFESKLLSSLPAGLPLPLPADYLEGLDALQLINDVGEYPEYLFGRWSREGSRLYYLVVILYKTPLPLLAALLVVPFARTGQKGQHFLWLPALVLLAFFSTSKVHYGIRYILPVFPLLFINISRLVPWVRTRGRALQVSALVLLLIYPFSALLSTPDTISYFNILAGGQGDRILLDSNIDWGQGLKRVRAFMDREGIDQIGLAYFGHVDPAIYGIQWDFPRPDHPGFVAVSANFLHGYPYATYREGRIVPIPPNAFTWIGRFPRVAELGGGMFVYRIGR